MVTTTNLVAYYKFDEAAGSTAIDSHGIYSGTAYNGVVFNQTGKINTGYQFDPANDYVDIPMTLPPNFSLSGVAINLWIKPDVDFVRNIGIRTFFDMYDGTNRFNMDYNAYNGEFRVFYGNNVRLETSFSGGVWYMLTANVNNTHVDALINGVSVGSVAHGGLKSFGSTGSFRIGENYALSSNRCMDGIIDEVAIFNDTLTQQDIDDLYNSSDGLAYPFSGGGTELIGYPDYVIQTYAIKLQTTSYESDLSTTTDYLVQDYIIQQALSIEEQLESANTDLLFVDYSTNDITTAYESELNTEIDNITVNYILNPENTSVLSELETTTDSLLIDYDLLQSDEEVRLGGVYITYDNDRLEFWVNGANVYWSDGKVTATNTGRIVKTTRTTSNLTLKSSHHNVFCDTDSSAINISLPSGVNGQTYRIINTGSSGNDVTIIPSGTQLIVGDNSNKTISDGSIIVLTYDETEGWW